ncbi:MAG: hypothetical protein Tsb005_20130 [Gammaproteobacteria bacterium]
MRTPTGFLFPMKNPNNAFEKPPLSIAAQLEQLSSRGVIIQDKVMTSWLHALTYLCNLCAHHSKLWNRNFTLKPLIANGYKQQLKNNRSFSAQAAILKIFLDVISPGSGWAKHLRVLISDHPNIVVNRMGFSNDWQSDAFWH